ncbi:MAG: hypothetical protein KF691_10980 [Phycisphaeraceae bacterium]|nr:hypothetical protein [Phycisphaeraceae bacterium]
MSAASSILNSTSTQTSAQPSGFSALSSEQFTKIILTELANQDPLSPSDTNALLQQLSSIRNIQSSMDLSEKLGSLVSDNQFAAASNMMGKIIGGISTDNVRTIGRVDSVSKTDDGVFLNLNNGLSIHMKNMDGIIDVATLSDEEKELLGLK